jgi:hypothetical protein
VTAWVGLTVIIIFYSKIFEDRKKDHTYM